MTRLQLSFLALVATQAAHSVEEYVGRLYDVFPPAQFVSGLISQDRERGFVILNITLVTFGLWCFIWPVRKKWLLRILQDPERPRPRNRYHPGSLPAAHRAYLGLIRLITPPVTSPLLRRHLQH
jgi:hypothetical protein